MLAEVQIIRHVHHYKFKTRIVAFVAGLSWFISLLLPALAISTPHGSIRWFLGLEILFDGPAGIVVFELGWYANVLMMISLIRLLRGHIRLSLVEISAFFLAISSFQNLLLWEGPVVARGAGFYLWIASFTILLIGTIWLSFRYAEEA